MDTSKHSPLISFLVPVYNGEAYIGRCLGSLAEQGDYDFEVIVVNDGSTDNTMDLVRAYCARDKRFRCISQENRGYVKTMNRLIALAGGDYLYSVDADNWIPKKLVRNTYGFLLEGHLDFVQYSLTLVDQVDESFSENEVFGAPKKLSNRLEILDAMRCHDVYLASHGGKFIRRELAALFLFHGEPTGSDRMWIGQVLAVSSSGLIIPDTGLFVDMRADSISRKTWRAADHFRYSAEMLEDIGFYNSIEQGLELPFFPQLWACFGHYYSGIHAVISEKARLKSIGVVVGKKIWKFRRLIFPPTFYKQRASRIWLICRHPNAYILLYKARGMLTRKMVKRK